MYQLIALKNFEIHKKHKFLKQTQTQTYKIQHIRECDLNVKC